MKEILINAKIVGGKQRTQFVKSDNKFNFEDIFTGMENYLKINTKKIMTVTVIKHPDLCGKHS